MVGIFEAAGYAAMEKASELTPPYNPSEIMSRTNRINYHHNNYDGKRIADSILDDIGYAGERRFDRHDPADRIINPLTPFCSASFFTVSRHSMTGTCFSFFQSAV